MDNGTSTPDSNVAASGSDGPPIIPGEHGLASPTGGPPAAAPGGQPNEGDTRLAAPAPIQPSIATAKVAADQLSNARALAAMLAGVIKERNLFLTIKYKQRDGSIKESHHVYFEGWTTTGALCGPVLGESIFPINVWTRRLVHARDGIEGWEARVEARGYSGALVGAAEAMCLRAESRWAGSPEYQLRSMAQTRAGSKALRIALGWIISLAGFDTTPAEEMQFERHDEDEGQPRRKPPAKKGGKAAPKKDSEAQAKDQALGLLMSMWPNWVEAAGPVAVMATVLNLPHKSRGSIKRYWLDVGGTWGQAKAIAAEVKRKAGEDADMARTIEVAQEVDAYGKMTAAKDTADEAGQQTLPMP